MKSVPEDEGNKFLEPTLENPNLILFLPDKSSIINILTARKREIEFSREIQLMAKIIDWFPKKRFLYQSVRISRL